MIQFPKSCCRPENCDFAALALALQQQWAAATYSTNSGVQRKDFC